jgi:hypothetical protein
MATYNTIYTGIFDAFDAPGQYSIEIAKKDYVGDSSELTLSAIPVTQEWQEEGPKFPIKGCNLTVRMISKRLNGIEASFTLADFYSEEDDTFLVYLYDNTTGAKLFKGYIVQDDCKEIQVDYAHEIVISATDNLGLLKERRFDEAALITGTSGVIEAAVIFQAPHTIYISYSPGNPLPFGAGTQITIFNVRYNITSVGNEDLLFGWPVTVVQEVDDAPLTITFVQWFTPISINGYLPLSQVFRICLASLGLDLGAKVYSELYPIGGTEGRWLDDTYIVGESFFNNEQWLTCYEILERILIRFRASLFQSYGFWTIVRWGELWRYTTVEGATLSGYNYNRNWEYLGSAISINNFHFGDGTDCETGVLRSINRPWNFVEETFNYNNTELLRNINLQELGAFLRSYEVDTNTYYEYELPYWVNFDYTPPPTTNPVRFIRIVKDENNNEIDRYIVLTGEVTPYPYAALQSPDIFLSSGDTIEWSFDFKAKLNFVSATPLYAIVSTSDGTTTYYLNKFGYWQTTIVLDDMPQYLYASPSDPRTEWHNWKFLSKPLPLDSKLNVFLITPTAYSSPWEEMHFKNLFFNVTYLIDGTITGHRHTDTQVPSKVIKNNETVDIFVDDSPRSSIAGTLYIDTYNGLNRNRTTKWNYTGASLEYSLGQLVTIEQLFQRWYPKDIYNGTTTYIKNGIGLMMTPMSVFLNMQEPELKRYVTGSLSIDYKNSAADFTLYELDNSDRTMAEFNLNNLYDFVYLYEKS